MEERKKKGLCYNFDDKWAPGHKCKSAKLFLLEGVEIVPASGVQITEMEEDGMEGVIKSQDEGIEEAEITLYALVGSPTPGTVRVNGMIMGEGLIIILDSGSTHNFIDAALLLKLSKHKGYVEMWRYRCKVILLWCNYMCCP